jgi:hypothetical protein
VLLDSQVLTESLVTIATLSSCELNQDASCGMKAAHDGPVFITDRRHPTHVLPTMLEYQHLIGGQPTLLEALAQLDVADFDFDPSPVKGLYHSADSTWLLLELALLDGGTRNPPADPTLSVIYSEERVDEEACC